MSIQVRDIHKSYGTFEAVRGVSLDVEHGEMVALLGPSGSGKTTLLRIIAGLERADSGSILLEGQDATRHTAAQRRVGFVFQHYALFRHMTAFENVAFGLRVQPAAARPTRSEIQDRVIELLKLVQLESHATHYPGQLSGGQRQRVALARALAVQPKVLLLDEPFGALDAKVRKELRRWLRRLQDEIHVTSLLVTHDQEEALEVADRVAILNAGELEQVGTPEEVYDRRRRRLSSTSSGTSIYFTVASSRAARTWVRWKSTRPAMRRIGADLRWDTCVRTRWKFRGRKIRMGRPSKPPCGRCTRPVRRLGSNCGGATRTNPCR